MNESAESEPITSSARARRREHRSGMGLVLALGLAFFIVIGRAVDIATGPVPPRRGAIAPSFTALDLSGTEQTLAQFRGRVVLLDFWATWCPPCVASMPELERTYQSLSNRGFVVVGINQEPESPDRVRGFVSSRGLSFPVVLDPGGIRRDFGVHSFPTSFLVDREGTICEVYRGPVSPEKLSKAIEALLVKPPGSPAC
jgi:peroxiredoxin